MVDAATLMAPKVTMPEAEAAFLRAAYQRAGGILEYGTGGSTTMAAAVPGAVVWSVESDRAFLDDMAAWFEAHPPKARVHLHHANIGPTGKWGAPRDDTKWRRWKSYPLGVWDAAGFQQPDVVLIDGRFRAACFLAVAFRTARPVNVFWDDYVDRERYHEVERLAKPAEIVGRMARFEVEPMQPTGADLAWIMDVFGRRQ